MIFKFYMINTHIIIIIIIIIIIEFIHQNIITFFLSLFSIPHPQGYPRNYLIAVESEELQYTVHTLQSCVWNFNCDDQATVSNMVYMML